MRTYVVKRIGISILILICVTFIIYGLMRSLPSSYVENMAMQLSQQPGAKSYEEWIAQLNTQYGLDQGIFSGYLTWLADFMTGNFGESWSFNVPVLTEFNNTIGISFAMGSLAFLFSTAIAVPLGIIAATHQYSKTDYVISALALLGISLPTFFFATVLKLIFSVQLGWLDLYGLTGRNFNHLSEIGQMLDIVKHMIMPVVTLTVIQIGSLMRFTRTNMLEVLNADYIRTARTKGLPNHTVIYKHAFRNTLIPLVTIIGDSLPGLFSGALITETLFSIPGTGYTSYQAMTSGDIPYTMFFLTFITIITLLSNLLTDIMYAWVDPRVRIS